MLDRARTLLLSSAILFLTVAVGRAAETFIFVGLDTDPGWFCGGLWSYGIPAGEGSYCGDPTSGRTGSKIYGYNIWSGFGGDYDNNIPAYYLESESFDCSGYENVTLEFWRWLGVDSSLYDHAAVEVSTDYYTWHTVWENDGAAICDSQWVRCSYDISDVADDAPALFIRWRMGPTNESINYPGWSIDDISLIGEPIDDMSVSPDEDIYALGFEGGPFEPPAKTFTVSNDGAAALNWSVSINQTWLSVDPPGGVVPPGEPNYVQAWFNSTASLLSPGVYNDTITFRNLDSGNEFLRPVTLEVLSIPGEIQVTDSVPPIDDACLPFGPVIAGLQPIEQITITNLDVNYSLTISDIILAGDFIEDCCDLTMPGWSAQPHSAWSVTDYTYRADAGTADVKMNSIYLPRHWDDFYAEVTTFRTGNTQSPALLAFRISDDFNYASSTGSCYCAAISAQSQYYVAKYVDGAFAFLQPWTSSFYLNSGPSVANTIAVDVVGSSIKLYLNGYLAWAGIDEQITGTGRVGLLAYSGDTTETIHFFDDLRVGDPLGSPISIGGIQQWHNENAYQPSDPYRCPSDHAIPHYPAQRGLPEEPSPLIAPLLSESIFAWAQEPCLPMVIAPLDSVTLDVIFSPPAVDNYDAPLVIYSTDADEPEFTVSLTGTGIAPLLSINPDSDAAFAGHPGGPFNPSVIQYQLTNATAEETFDWTVQWNQPWLNVAPAAGNLSPSQSVVIDVTLTAAAQNLSEDIHYDTLTFTNQSTMLQQTRLVTCAVFTEPNISCDPNEFVLNVKTDSTLTDTLLVANSGDAPLEFYIRTHATGFTPLLPDQDPAAANATQYAADQPISQLTDNNDHAPETLILQYSFPQPTFDSQSDGFDHIQINGLDSCIREGAPIIPVRTARVLLPFGKRFTAVRAIPLHTSTIPDQYNLAPGPRPQILGPNPHRNPNIPNPQIYSQTTPYPGINHQIITLQNQRGCQVLFINLFPIQYTPADGTINYTTQIRLEIDLADASPSLPPRLTPSVADSLRRSTDNPQQLRSYSATDTQSDAITDTTSGSILPDDGPFNYVVITNAELAQTPGPWNFAALCAAKTARGIPATIVTTEWIYSNYPGPRPDGGADNQARIRAFLIDAYENWNTQYVLLAGTNDIVPARMFWVETGGNESTATTMPVDMYYGCVDPAQCSFDYDADGLYGEPSDGVNGGEVDLLAEIYVGRAAVSNYLEVQNFVRKTLTYHQSNGAALTRVAMLGEFLDFGGPADYAKGMLEQIRLGGSYDGYSTIGFVDHGNSDLLDFQTISHIPDLPDACWPLYEQDAPWSSQNVIDLINNSFHVFNHLGHCNTNSCIKLNTYSLGSLTNDDYFFVYSQGCRPGWFDLADCWGEVVTTMQHGAFAAVLNARDGWGWENSTDGPSHRFNRQFWHAVLSDGILELGRANQASKEANLWDIEGPCIRWCYYELTLFGDPEQQLRFTSDCDWITVYPDACTVPSSDQLSLQLTFDAAGLFPGTYTADITIYTNDPNNPSVVLPVTMNVQPATILGDFNRDGVVDIIDLAIFTSWWRSSTCQAENYWCGATDMNCSGFIDLVDFAHFADCWGDRLPFPGDLNADGIVDLHDFAIFVACTHLPDDQCDIAPLPNGDNRIDILDLMLLTRDWLQQQ
ncbi:MAG: hypothetical protein JW936_07465 [Sedimentisphaerales bacterium]|nr:hypothetical protein [Sedimentisphaerales bacterium]